MKGTAQHQSSSRFNPGLVLLAGAITPAAVLLAYGALDDITTDNATTFIAEFSLLLVSVCWCLFLAIEFLRRRKSWIGIVSVLLVLAAVWGHGALSPATTPSLHAQYFTIVVALVWFLVVSITMIVAGFRRLS